MPDIKWEPYAKPEPGIEERAPTRGAGILLSQGGEEESPASYSGKSLLVGLGEQTGKDIEASVPLQLEGVSGLPESLFRQYLPRELVDKVFPAGGMLDPKVSYKDPATGKRVDTTYRQMLINKHRATSPESFKERVGRGKAPGELSEEFGAGMEALGATIANPLGAPIKMAGVVSTGAKAIAEKYGPAVMMALGAGMGGDIGSKAGKSAGRTVGEIWDQFWGSKGGGEKGEAVGGAVGAFAGGAGGANLNVVRGKVMGAGARAYTAAKAAREAQKAKEGKVFENFKDTYSALNADAHGIIQQHVNGKVADTLAANKGEVTKNFTEFDEAAIRVGLHPDDLSFDLAQRSADPNLVEHLKLQVPRDAAEREKYIENYTKQVKAITDAHEKIMGGKATAKDVVESMEQTHKEAVAKGIVEEALKKRAQDGLTHYGPVERTKQGEAIAGAYQQRMEELRPIRDGWYNRVKTTDALNPHQFDMGGVEKEVREVLDTTLARMDKGTIPESIVKLDQLLGKAKGTPAKTQRVQDPNTGIFTTQTLSPGKKAEPITTQDMLDITKAVNRERPKDATEARNLAIVKDALEKAWKTAPKETYEAYRKAQDNYKNLWAPMFKTGVNANLDRRAGVNRQGEAYYTPDAGLTPYLKESEITTRMQQFDDLWGGGKLGKRDEGAYKQLEGAIQDIYHKEMFNKDAKYTPNKHDQFMKNWDPVFQRVPEAKKAIEAAALKVFEHQANQENIKAKFRETFGVKLNPLNASLGKDKADKLVSRALTDPRQMRNLVSAMKDHGGTQALMKDVAGRMNLMEGGVFSPEKMEGVLRDSKPGLMALFTEAMGPAQAVDHYKTLESIALLAKRAKIAEGRPGVELKIQTLKDISGFTAGSAINDVRGALTGRTSGVYVGGSWASRYLNQALQKALVDAEKKAISDPEMAKAVMELYSKHTGESLTNKTVKTIAKQAEVAGTTHAKRLYEWLLDRHYVTQTTIKGGQLGVTGYADKEEDNKE